MNPKPMTQRERERERDAKRQENQGKPVFTEGDSRITKMNYSEKETIELSEHQMELTGLWNYNALLRNHKASSTDRSA